MPASSNHQQTNFTQWFNDQFDAFPDNLSAIAKKTGLTLAYLSMLKSGKRRRPSRKTVEKLAEAFGADWREAMAAADLPLPHGTPTQPTHRYRSREALAHAPASVDLRRPVKTGQVSILTEVKPIAAKTFQVRIQQINGASVDRTLPCYVRWFAHGEEQAAAPASAQGITFTLREGEHELRCEWVDEAQAVVFNMRIGVSPVEGAHSAENAAD